MGHPVKIITKKSKRRKRERRKKTSKSTITTYVVTKDKREFTTLNSIYNIYPKHERLKIKIRKGTKDMTNYRALAKDETMMELKKHVKQQSVYTTSKIKLKRRTEKKVSN